MSKEKNNTKENTDNPFAGFGVINLSPAAPSIIQAPKVEEPAKIETGDKVPNLTEDEHKEKAAKATEEFDEPAPPLPPLVFVLFEPVPPAPPPPPPPG